MTTLCINCKHCDKTKQNPELWLCKVSKKETTRRFVTGTPFSKPRFCDHVNTEGKCPKYEAI